MPSKGLFSMGILMGYSAGLRCLDEDSEEVEQKSLLPV
jgi:hypothetical protein